MVAVVNYRELRESEGVERGACWISPSTAYIRRDLFDLDVELVVGIREYGYRYPIGMDTPEFHPTA